MNDFNDKKSVEKIRSGYEDRQPTKTEQLKTLDKKVRRPAEIFAYIFGSVCALIFGTGMCLAMKVIFADLHIAVGIAIGLVGAGLCVLNYYLYKAILKRRKAKYGEQILKLCDEAIKGE